MKIEWSKCNKEKDLEKVWRGELRRLGFYLWPKFEDRYGYTLPDIIFFGNKHFKVFLMELKHTIKYPKNPALYRQVEFINSTCVNNLNICVPILAYKENSEEIYSCLKNMKPPMRDKCLWNIWYGIVETVYSKKRRRFT